MTEPAPGNPSTRFDANADGESKVYQAGRDQYLTVSSPAGKPKRRATPIVTQTLPRDITAFTGRDDELAQLLEQISVQVGSAIGVFINAIDGMAGVGKTTFAVHAAHILAKDYPDGQLFLHLHAHSPGQSMVTPFDALGSLLLSLGVSARNIPTDIDSRAAMWRHHLSGRRMLLLFDDAASHQQVYPLLPGSPGCLVLITSRRRLAALSDASTLTLGTLTARQSTELFNRLAGRPNAGTGDEAGVVELVRRCGYLPLAVTLLAGRLKSHPAWTVGYLVDILRHAQDRLAEIRAENIEVAAAFGLSYEDLPGDQKQLFRRLGLHPGPDIDLFAAAALDHTGLAETRQRLDALHNDHLIDEHSAGRYRFHDLIRDHARHLSSLDDLEVNDLAADRLLDYYIQSAMTANRYIARRTDPVNIRITHVPDSSPRLTTWREAVSWLEAERSNLGACVEYASAHGRRTRVVQISTSLHSFLRLSGHYDQALAIHETAVAAAAAEEDELGKAGALTDVGRILYLLGRCTEAIAALTDSHDRYRNLSDELGQANALTDLGTVRYTIGDCSAASGDLTEALGLYRDLGDALGQANALNNLGRVKCILGEYASAVALLEEGLALYRTIDSRLGQANTLTDLGRVQRLICEYPAATATLTEALEIYRGLGDRQGHASALTYLGTVQYTTGSYAASVATLTEALMLFRDLGDQFGQANALIYLGRIQRVCGDHTKAIATLDESLSIARRIGDRLSQIKALTYIGVVQYLTERFVESSDSLTQAIAMARDLNDRVGQANALNYRGRLQYLVHDFPGATSSLEEALASYEELGDRLGQAEVLNNIGSLMLLTEGRFDALTCHQRSLGIAREVYSPLEEARALEGIGRVQLRRGQRDHAARSLRSALEVYQKIGASEVESVVLTLDSL